MDVLALDARDSSCAFALAQAEQNEACLSGFVVPAGEQNGGTRYIVRALRPVPDAAYIERTPHYAQLHPDFCLDMANQSRHSGEALVLCHTHPGDSKLAYSTIDDRAEIELRKYFDRRASKGAHFSLLFSSNGVIGRELGRTAGAKIQIVGDTLRTHSATTMNGVLASGRFSRQVLAFGAAAQKALMTLRIAIVGLGGTGSIVAHELAHLGVRDYLLIDRDYVEESNLNRLLGATPNDIGSEKATLIAREIRRINAAAACEAIVGDIVAEDVAIRLATCEFIFLCTDSHASRAIVNQLAYQFFIPCIDVGVGIHSKKGLITDIVGRVQMISPGLPCLLCAGWIDSNLVRIEMMNPEERARDPYFVGEGVPQPAVISLNGTVTSLAVTMFLAAVASFPARPRMLLYDAMRGTIRPTVMEPVANCIVCSPAGAHGRGAAWPLPARNRGND